MLGDFLKAFEESCKESMHKRDEEENSSDCRIFGICEGTVIIREHKK